MFFGGPQPCRFYTKLEPPQTWPWPERGEADIREDQTRRIVEWLREDFQSSEADDPDMRALKVGMARAAEAIDAAFGTYEPGSD